MSQKRSAPPSSPVVIELLDSDDEENATIADNMSKRLKTTLEPGRDFISIDDDSDDGGGKLGPCCRTLQAKCAVKKESAVVTPTQEISEHPNEVEVLTDVQGPAMEAVTEFASTPSEDDIQVIGCKNQTKLPHMRQHCTHHEFVQDVCELERGSRCYLSTSKDLAKKGMELNPVFCDMCFCYVCDVPAKECKNWKCENGSSLKSRNHCHASDKGVDSYAWKQLRNASKSHENDPATAHRDWNPEEGQHTYGGSYGWNARRELGPGPFDPDNATDQQKSMSTKCRKCGWYSLLQNHRPQPGCLDWCHKCGRICSEVDLGKSQSVPYQPDPTDTFLGSKTVPFTIVSHDPRKFDSYKSSWVANEGKPGWVYNRSEMEEDMFRHRFGQRPKIATILESIPVLSPDKIPETGATKQLGHNCKKSSATETEYVVLSNRNHKALFQEIYSNSEYFGRRTTNRTLNRDFIAGDVSASWDKSERKGTIVLRVYFRQRAFSGTRDGSSLARFLGCWYDSFPFTLSSLTRGLDAPSVDDTMYSGYSQSLFICAPPYRVEKEEAGGDATVALAASIYQSHSESAASYRSKLSFASSTGENSYGGCCARISDFSSFLKAFFAEYFTIDLCDSGNQDSSLSFYGKALGIVSDHRRMRKDQDIPTYSGRDNPYFRSYVRDEDHHLANSLASVARSARSSVMSLDHLLQSLENLGHAPVPHVEGLTVELLEFQKQTVQWAIERETANGGIQSYFWTKLPALEDAKSDVYFNPILSKLSRSKPAVVRGGMICEEMGLGKTVISLALILKNPAPAHPLSGSVVKFDRNANWDGNGWNPNTASGPNGKGSKLSRGTLVICHVSLVGQWIEESKSKLSDPGLVYPYHGQSRKRDAEILAKNAIVVTTYATLSSDKNYHAKKRGDSYCPPCEQVRWWRIICDESHSLRDAGTKQSRAVMDLVADNKWCVTGTPMNTTIKDLKNQLKFVGIENVEPMFSRFHEQMMNTNSRRRSKHGGFRSSANFGPFLFFMRQVMMRHSMKQKYVGTSTELMALPSKEERALMVDLSEEEKAEYSRMENAAKKFYENFKLREGHQLSKHYLLLFQKLTPLRIACCGGAIPEQEEDGDPKADSPEEERMDSDDEDMEEKPKKKKKKKTVLVSNMVFKSKLNVLVQQLEKVRDEEPHAKSLIFSQFTSTLKFLQEELPKHGFDFRTLSGDMSMKKRAKALHDFQNDPPTTIFLLSTRAGACGINLTQANRVFILEPAFNPALEAQAIGRVWRMGQTQKVKIIRLITNNSVESRLRKVLDKKYGKLDDGTSTENASGDGDEDSAGVEDHEAEAEASPAAKVASAVPGILGNIRSDRTKVLTEEFDELFGVSEDSKPAPVSSSDGNTDISDDDGACQVS